jgi:hypothetical protein
MASARSRIDGAAPALAAQVEIGLFLGHAVAVLKDSLRALDDLARSRVRFISTDSE